MNILKKKINLTFKNKPVNLSKSDEGYKKYYFPISKE